nr:CPBP family intramembrane glutamic endopeptidase [Clostridium sp. YIM B02551]
MVFFELIPLYILLKKFNNSLKSVGINFSNILMDCIKGILFFIPIIFIYTFCFRLKYSINFNLTLIIDTFILLVQVALVEEIIFRGYLQSRISCLIKNKFLSIFLVSLMFALIHLCQYIPFPNIDRFLVTSLIIQSATYCISHFYYTFICAKSNSIFASTITHFLKDLLLSTKI